MEEKQFPATTKKLLNLAKKGDYPNSVILTRSFIAIGTLIILIAYNYLFGSDFIGWTKLCLIGDLSFVTNYKNSLNRNTLLELSFLLSIVVLFPTMVSVFFTLSFNRFLIFKDNKDKQLKIFNITQGFNALIKKTKLLFRNYLLFLTQILGLIILMYYFNYLNSTLIEGITISSFYKLILYLGLVTICSGMIELFLEFRSFSLRNRMSFKEIKEEIKSEEGDPYLKMMRSNVHREILYKELVQRVKNSKVIIIDRK